MGEKERVCVRVHVYLCHRIACTNGDTERQGHRETVRTHVREGERVFEPEARSGSDSERVCACEKEGQIG